MRRRRGNVTVALVVAGVLAATVGAIWLLAPDGGGGGGDASATATSLTAEQERQRAAAEAWVAASREAFSDLGAVVPLLVRRTDEWLAGDLDTDALAADLETWARVASDTRDAVGELEAFELAPGADRLLELSAELYVEVVEAHRAALSVPDGDLRTQVQLLARRVRTLADRVFDRGYVLVEPFLFREEDPNVTVNLPEEVPIWPELGLAPGPPLAPEPVSVGDRPSLREDRRPEQARADWIGALQLVNPPSADELAAALHRGTEEELRALAERLIGGAEALRDEPDPRDDREASARVRLGLLVHADAARAGQAAALTAGTAASDTLRAVGLRLAVIGGDEMLWVPELPSRSPNIEAPGPEQP